MRSSGLTVFGVACREHRIRIGAVMAKQSRETGFPSAVISAVERGAMRIPDDYLKKLVEWLQLDSSEASELALLAKLKRTKTENLTRRQDDFLRILKDTAPNPPADG